ncbi:hypothetical protein QYE76_013845 [Lolium multiflorum]|uniref:Uncharacterized protein n=1 Tax=Lolium multiflorum TaxID=4521 RepID=A0AAD8U3F7_LOLMU|nr:hypothetical protein QYE76_013845 [Lolium multiflorum]
MGTLHHCFPGVIFQQQSETLVPLLCSLVDLLAIKGCFELQFELCKLIIMIWKQENLPLEKVLCQEDKFSRQSVSLSSIYLGGKSPVIMKFQ